MATAPTPPVIVKLLEYAAAELSVMSGVPTTSTIVVPAASDCATRYVLTAVTKYMTWNPEASAGVVIVSAVGVTVNTETGILSMTTDCTATSPVPVSRT